MQIGDQLSGWIPYAGALFEGAITNVLGWLPRLGDNGREQVQGCPVARTWPALAYECLFFFIERPEFSRVGMSGTDALSGSFRRSANTKVAAAEATLLVYRAAEALTR